MKNKHKKIIQRLISSIRDRSFCVGNAKVAACLVYKNKVFFGENKAKTNSFMYNYYNEYNVYTHAEVDAIKQASKSLTEKEFSKATLYIVRVKKSGELALARPCKKGCQQLIRSYGIKSVIYTTNEHTFERLSWID